MVCANPYLKKHGAVENSYFSSQNRIQKENIVKSNQLGMERVTGRCQKLDHHHTIKTTVYMDKSPKNTIHKWAMCAPQAVGSHEANSCS